MNWARKAKKSVPGIWNMNDMPVMKALEKGETYTYPPTMIHGAMWYKCDKCGKKWHMWLEKGLEDKIQDALEPDKHKPVPFIIGCTCGGQASHVDWNNDIRLGGYRPLGDNMSYFKNDLAMDCGKPVIR
jgi:hypothetical protein